MTAVVETLTCSWFLQADADNGGTVDFAEFLKVVVGNLVSI